MLDVCDHCTRGALSTGAETASSRLNGGALCIGPGDEARDGVAGAAADRAGSGSVVVAAGEGQEDLGPEDLDGRGDARATELGQLLPPLHGELAERCLLVAGYAASVAREAAYHRRAHDTTATGRPFDPLGDGPDPWTQRVLETGMPRRPFAISRLEWSTPGGGTIGSGESPSPGRPRTGPSSEPVAADDRSGLRGSGPGQSGLLDRAGPGRFASLILQRLRGIT